MSPPTPSAPPLSGGARRRRRAWDLHPQGGTQQRMAAALGCSQSSISGWHQRAQPDGVEALRHDPSPGPTPLLSPSQRAQIPALLASGAEVHGWRGAVWTTRRVAQAIGDHSGVYYHPAHVSRLLRHLVGWRSQQPLTRATQRAPAAVAAWRQQRHAAGEKSDSRRTHPRLGRRSGLLPAARAGAHLRLARADPALDGAADRDHGSVIAGLDG